MTPFLCSLIGWKAGNIARQRSSKMACLGRTSSSNSCKIPLFIPLFVDWTFLARGNPPTGFYTGSQHKNFTRKPYYKRGKPGKIRATLQEVLWPVNEKSSSITPPRSKSQASPPRARTWLTLIMDQRPVSTKHARAEFKQKRSLEILSERTIIWDTSRFRRTVLIRTHFTAPMKRYWLFWRIALKWSQWTYKLRSTNSRTLYFLGRVFTESSNI